MRQSSLDISNEAPTSNISQEKLLMFLNDPILYRCKSLDYIVYKEKDFSGNNLQIALKKIFANEKVIRRYKVLQDAKELLVQEKDVDTSVDFLITHLEAIEENSAKQIMETQNEKEKLIEGFKEMQRREKKLEGQFDDIRGRIEESNLKFDTLDNLKKTVDKMVEKTETIRALTISNKSLREENMKLTSRLQESERMIQKLMNQIKYLKQKKE